jgi:hypothetical protein
MDVFDELVSLVDCLTWSDSLDLCCRTSLILYRLPQRLCSQSEVELSNLTGSSADMSMVGLR